MVNNRRGTGFTNLQTILNANRANRLGQVVSSGVNKAGEAAKSAINAANTQFQQDLEKEKQRRSLEGERVNRVLGNVAGASDEDVNAFASIRGAEYKGPQGYQNSDVLQDKAGEARQLGQLGSSYGGRVGLLQRYAAKGPRYSAGQQRLDSLLLGQTGAGDLRQARKSTAGLDTQLARQETAASERVKEGQGQARQLADVAIKGLESNLSAYDEALKQRASEAQLARDAQIAQLKADIASGKIDKATADAMTKEGKFNFIGNDNQGLRTYDVDLSRFAEFDPTKASELNVRTQEDLNKMAALRRLSGQSLGSQGSALLDKYLVESNAGEFGKSPLIKGYDEDAAILALQEARDKYTPEMSRLQQIIDAQNALAASAPNQYKAQAVEGGRANFEDATRQLENLKQQDWYKRFIRKPE